MDWFKEYLEEKQRADRAEGILKHLEVDGTEYRRLQHMYDLEEKNKKLKHALRWNQVALEDRNRTLAATNLIINCTGCEAGGPPNKEMITEDLIREIEKILVRLKTWLKNHQHRKNQES